MIGPVASTPTVWRALSEVGQVQLARVNAATTSFRRHWWGLLAARPEGFPWLTVARRELSGVTVVDLDASIVFATSDKETCNPPTRVGSGSAPTWPSATTPMTSSRSTRAPVARRPTAPRTDLAQRLEGLDGVAAMIESIVGVWVASGRWCRESGCEVGVVGEFAEGGLGRCGLRRAAATVRVGLGR